MKKYLFMVCALALGALTFNSCGSDSDDDAPATNLPQPKLVGSAQKFVFLDQPATQNGVQLDKPSNLYIERAEFSEGGVFVGKVNKTIIPANSKFRRIRTEAVGDIEFEWVIGDYTVSAEGNFIVNGGEFVFTVNSAQGNTASVTLTVPQILQAVTLFGNELKIMANGTTEGNLCRTWKVVKTNLLYTPYENGKPGTNVAKSWNHANLKEISDYLYNEQNLDIRDDLLKHGDAIEKIVFTKRGSFAIDFGDDICMGDWKWQNQSNGTFSYTWYEDDMENPFDGEGATVRFDGNNCVLVLNGNVKESSNNKRYQVFLTFTMQAPQQ
ncbi:MAG: hypothetical protein IJ586_04010 [Alloprevotella sp.]|nr:hypothetical protein [Alloprevotella sp.]